MRINPNNFVQGLANAASTLGKWLSGAKERIVSWLKPGSKEPTLALSEKVSTFTRMSLTDARKELIGAHKEIRKSLTSRITHHQRVHKSLHKRVSLTRTNTTSSLRGAHKLVRKMERLGAPLHLTGRAHRSLEKLESTKKCFN
jgi:hypothetical protein